MKRLCIFAHWDKDNIIDDYVIYYLKSLQEICETIIFVSDCNLKNEELDKLKDITKYCIAQKHGEYDFGSYKRGYFFAKTKHITFDELLLVNDSCYGPFYSFKTIFNKMDKKRVDFWGLTQNSFGIKKIKNGYDYCYSPHIQSYFILLKKQTFNDFEQFLETIQREENKEDIVIKYEIMLTKSLQKKGFKYSVFINKFKHTENCTLSKWESLSKKYKFPLLKTSIARKGLLFWGKQNWQDIVPKSYPIEIINKQLLRYSEHYPKTIFELEYHDRFIYFIHRYLPFEVFLISKFLDRKILSNFRRFFRNILNSL